MIFSSRTSPRSLAAFCMLFSKSFFYPGLLRPLGRSLKAEARGVCSSNSCAKARIGILISTASVPLSGRDLSNISLRFLAPILSRLCESASVNLASRSLELQGTASDKEPLSLFTEGSYQTRTHDCTVPDGPHTVAPGSASLLAVCQAPYLLVLI